MPRTRRDVLISTLILGTALAALGWFFLASPGLAEPEGIHMLALVLGGLGTAFGLFLVLNFRAAHRQVARLATGQGVVARWHITPGALAEFLQLDKGFTTPNGWSPSRRDRRDGAEVIFGQELMVLGSRFQALPTAGLESVRDVRIEGGPVLCLAVVTRGYYRVGSSLTAVDTLWRIPVIDPEAANAVVRHFQAALSGQIVSSPKRWLWRFRVAQVLLVVLPLVGLYGWYLLSGPELKTEEELLLPMILLLVGILGTIGAAIAALVTASFHRRQHGGRK